MKLLTVIFCFLILSCHPNPPDGINREIDIVKLEKCYDNLSDPDKSIQIARVINYYQFSKNDKAHRFLMERKEKGDKIAIDILNKSAEFGVIIK